MKSSDYPKKYMTISELLPYGFTRTELMNYCQMREFPAYKALGKTSPWKIDTNKLDTWLKRRFGS